MIYKIIKYYPDGSFDKFEKNDEVIKITRPEQDKYMVHLQDFTIEINRPDKIFRR